MPYMPDASFFEAIATHKPTFLLAWESLPVEAQTEHNAEVMKRAIVRFDPDAFLGWAAQPLPDDWWMPDPLADAQATRAAVLRTFPLTRTPAPGEPS